MTRNTHTVKPSSHEAIDARGKIPESWACIDCGVNTAPGMSNRIQVEQGLATLALTGETGVEQVINQQSEVYCVKPAIWKSSGMTEMGGCLCIGCLEKRLGRILTPKDFLRNHPFHSLPGTARLRSRRDGAWMP
jgi:hypothetical protein